MVRSVFRRLLIFAFAVTLITAALVTAVLHSYFDILNTKEIISVIIAVCAVLALSAFFCVIISRKITKSIINPINDLALSLDSIENAEMCEELRPFAAAISQQRKKEKELSRQKKQFTANLSHELKTPLTSIAGYAELIETGIAKDEDIRAFAKTIRKQALRLVTLSEDIIKLSQLEESDDAIAISLASVDLYDIAERCTQALAINARLRGIALELNGSSTFIKGNGALLEEMIYNLIDNAIRYNKDNGSISVTVSGDDDAAEISVRDTGIGIDSKYHDRIFERFFLVDKSRSKATGGTGLGLAIVKHIAKLHHAEIKIDSHPGTGTEISVKFKK